MAYRLGWRLGEPLKWARGKDVSSITAVTIYKKARLSNPT
jgi:hypothetical protein